MLGELTVEILQREYDMLKETNPMNVERLKKKIVLEYLRQRVTMMQQKEEEVNEARKLLDEQDNN
tara:strand:+ start:1241 stop:1435 length:195 start_codon:yes stop_codon:yes gene_type:complete